MRAECSIVMVSVMEKGYRLPMAMAIVIAPSPEKARKHAEEELKMYLRENRLLEVKTIEQILFEDTPTTIFLYTQPAERIK